MSRHRPRWVVVAFLLGLTASALADRPVEKRGEATHVVAGKVDAVYLRETKNYRHYIVEVRVSEVSKGAGLEAGKILYASCYRRNQGAGGLEADTAGHDVVPKEGERVKLFLNEHDGRYEGVYPDWVDVLGPQ